MQRIFFRQISNMVRHNVLCVAEKNDVAKTVSAIMSGGRSTIKPGPATYNKLYCFDATVRNQQSSIVFTSVSGHMKNLDFPTNFKNWHQIPIDMCFTAPVISAVTANMKPVEQQLMRESRICQTLIIWTDCDREGENIGAEIVEICQRANSSIAIYRARFSEITRAAVTRALNNLIHMDQRTIDAGAAFTRLQTMFIQRQVPAAVANAANKVVSYGSCQFPTMGFVVYRYLENVNFVPERFWKLAGKDVAKKVDFSWSRNRLFDERVVRMYLDVCAGSGGTAANISNVLKAPKSKWRPVALDTVELEKLAVRKLKITASRALAAAEKLYTKGFISYPRTETNIFPPDLNLDNLIQMQSTHAEWGQFAAEILQRGNSNPRNGNKTDNAHPPIHPLKMAKKEDFPNVDEWKVYELVVRYFLACCSRDARGNETRVTAKKNGETFTAFGLAIEDLGYLNVYPYDKWSAKEIPNYQQDELIPKFEVTVKEGSTTAPALLTEADLISLMDKHGIGTDATHAEHIEKVKQRNYVTVTNENRFKPTFMGMALVDGYNRMGQEVMSRPQLRAELERELVEIIEGRKTKNQVLTTQIRAYRNIFAVAERDIDQLEASLHQFMNRMPD